MPSSRNRVVRCGRIALAGLVIGAGVLVQAATKGPDAGGYVATDETVYSFVDVAGASGGAGLLAGTDDGLAALTLPFPFTFYGQAYASACVSTNGALYFVPSAGTCADAGALTDFANTDLTATVTPRDWPALLPFWSDLTFDKSGAGAVFYQVVGAAGSRRFVVQWQNAFPQGSANPVTFQVVLMETAGGDILFQYQNVDLGPGNPASGGALATVGIRAAGAPANGRHLQWSFDAPVLRNGTALAFSSAGDTTPPTVTATTVPATLWPPTLKPVPVAVSGTMSDAGSGIDPAEARFEVVDEYGQVQPSGPVTVGADGTYSFSVPLVAWRNGTDRDGRVYRIVVSVEDRAGNAASATAVVTVPLRPR